MALSPWTISGQSARTTANTKADKAAPNRSQTSFATVMARESGTSQEGQGKATLPQVARLPDAGLPINRTTLAGRSPNDLLRSRAFNKAQTDLTQTRTIDGLMQSYTGGSSLDAARGINAARNMRVIAANNQGRGFELSPTDFIRTRNSVSRAERATRSSSKMDTSGIGKLSARFESGGDGIAAIGYDSTGGTSYGKYQIASRVGSMKSFLNFLDSEAPDLAKRLRKAGPANTGGRKGAMPNEWRAIAKEQPERFEKLQEAFIHESHYKPALDSIEQRTGIDSSRLSPAMREVIWSTAVQHGPAGAARIFERADEVSGKPTDASYERKLITNVYKLRAGQFGSSTRQVREAVQSRFRQEKQLALNMLDGVSKGTLA